MKLYQLIENIYDYGSKCFSATYGIFDSYEKAKSELFRLVNNRETESIYYTIEELKKENETDEQFALITKFKNENIVKSYFDIIEFELNKALSEDNSHTYYN